MAQRPCSSDRPVDLNEDIDFHDLIMDAPLGVYASTPDGRFLFANSTMAQMYGYDSPEEMIQTVTDITAMYVDPSDREEFQCILEAEGKVANNECRMYCKDGSIIWVSRNAKIIRDKDGRTSHYQGFTTDVTDRRQAEEKLKTEKTFLSALLDNLGEAIVSCDSQGRIIRFNEAARRLHKMPEEPISPEGWAEHYDLYRMDGITPLPREEIPLYRALMGETVRNQEILVNPEQGSPTFLACNGQPMVDELGRTFGAVVAMFDITERKLMEEALLREQATLRAVIEAIPGTLNVMDRQYTILAMNQTGYRMKTAPGEQLPELVGRKCYEAIYNRKSPCTWCKVQQVLQTGEVVQEITSDGDPREEISGRSFQIVVNPITDQSGAITGVVEFGIDVTELKEAKNKAEQANLAKSVFLANMSHEIRTPINGISGMHQLLQDTPLNKEQQEYVRIAQQSTERLNRLLTDILDLSKIDSGKLELKEDAFHLQEALQSVEDIFRQACYKNGNSLQIVVDRNISEVLLGDTTRLTQILFNLVGNAAKYTREGTITVSAHLQSLIGPDRCRVLFVIEDSGQGIPEHQLSEVFETFTQANEPGALYTRQHEGAGLGLPLVKRLVSLMGGNAAICSQPSQGTTVYVSLPFHIPEAYRHEGIQSVEADSQSDSETRRVLLADDDSTTQIHIRNLLHKRGFSVQVVQNGEQVLNELAENRYDCILMDVQMPVLDGVETTRRIRETQDWFRDIPIIAITAYAMAGDRERFIQSGMNDYLTKPVHKDDLLDALNDNLSGCRN